MSKDDSSSSHIVGFLVSLFFDKAKGWLCASPFSLFFFFFDCFFLETIRAHGVASVVNLMLNGRKLFATNRTGHHIGHKDTSFLVDISILHEYQKFVKGARA